MSDHPIAPSDPQTALIEFNGGPVSLRMEVRLSPAGILAIGGLVSGILLSTAAVVWTATSVARRHPLASRIKPR
jgi:hypothetical protein